MSTVMESPAFGGVVRAELRFNRNRILPYALALVFAGNAFLWWGWGPAESRGVAVNGDAFIAGMLTIFSFMTAPFFTALMMADPVARDFEIGIDPLIFSKPLARATYLLGKFVGNYAVLLACQASFIVTLIGLQLFTKQGMIVEPFTILPYIRHFVIIVMVSHLALASAFFAIGTITRSTFAVMAATMGAYFCYILWQMLLRGASPSWRIALDPLLMNSFSVGGPHADGIVRYMPIEVANRGVLVAAAALSLIVLTVVFGRRELRPAGRGAAGLGLNLDAVPAARPAVAPGAERLSRSFGILSQTGAVLQSEMRLLLADRPMMVILPIAAAICFASAAVFRVPVDGTISGGYAAYVVNSLMPLILGIVVFHTGVVVHRDRQLRMAALVWSSPVGVAAVMLARYVAVLVPCIALCVVNLVAAVGLQAAREPGSVTLAPYLLATGLILLPALLFIAAISIAAAVVIRDKYAYYTVAITVSGGLLYLYNHGHSAWWYNPLHHRIWNYAHLLVDRYYAVHAAYWTVLAFVCLFVARFVGGWGRR